MWSPRDLHVQAAFSRGGRDRTAGRDHGPTQEMRGGAGRARSTPRRASIAGCAYKLQAADPMNQGPPLTGLRSEEARARLAEVGPNEPTHVRTRGVIAEVASLLANPLVLILLVAGVLSAFLGQIVD